MQTRTRNALVLAGVSAVAIAAGAWLWKERQTPARTPNALDAIPNDAMLVATADLGALRRSGAAAPLLSETREIPGLGPVQKVCGFDPLANLTEIAVAVPASGDGGELGLVAAGAVDDEALLACASKVIEARGGRSVVNTIGTFRTVRDASMSTSGAEIAVRKGGPVLLGAGTYLRAMIDTADGHVPSIQSDPGHARLASEVGEGSARVTVVLTPEQRRTLVEELAASGAQGSPAGSVTGVGLAVTLGARVDLHGVVACDAAKACAELSGVLDAKRAAGADDMLVRLVGIGAVLERMRITPTNDRIHARVDMATDEATTLIERILALRAAGRRADDDRPRRPREEPMPPPPDAVVEPGEGAERGAPDGGAEKKKAAPKEDKTRQR
ncbi:hypothetical protein [Polyangium aurulentum]|uniref:hypothetical protein n=1 Tax=Polyangium aurulentum TaxID=2567896 RepID=UPI0010AE4CDE|nr:hypothetical protein [Polyangium aurulentum]UQA60350.1 hypothetical protein E8A73_007715 [Polyangium aurulentum]